jgi:tetratricopeptide (TPR) repeat protein
LTEKELKKRKTFKGKLLSFDQAASFYFKRAERYADQNHYYDALAFYRKAYEKESKNSDYALAYASMLTEMGCFDESNLVIFDMLLNDQVESECFYGLGCNFLGLQELERSEECLQKYMQMDPDGEFIEDVEEMLFMFKASKWLPDSIGDLNSIFSSEGMEEAEKGKHALDMGEYKKAIFFLSKAVNRNPELTFAKNNLSIAYYCSNNLEQAIKITASILENEPDNVHACCNMAIYCGEKKDEEGLHSAVAHILELDYDNADDLQKAAVTLCELGMHPQAEAMLTELIEYKPYDKKLLHYLAVSKFNQGAYMTAELYWANILKMDPKNAIAPYYIALSREYRAKPGDQPRILSYYFQVPYDETLKRLRMMGQYYEQDGPSEIVKEEQLSLLMWGLELNDMDMKRRILTLIAGMGTRSAQRALRQFIMKRNESDVLKKEVFVLLRAMGAKEPYIAYIDNKLSEININVMNNAGGTVRSAIVSLITAMMEKDDAKKLELTLQVWETFTQANPHTKLNNPEAWGAALEYYTSNKYGGRMLKKTVCKKYGVSLSALNRRLDILRSGLEAKK